jgi:phage terminase small subunit
MKLTPKQERFIKEYLISLNATDAAIKAGYSEKTATKIGSENLTKPDIIAAIKAEQDKSSAKLEITRESLLETLLRIQANTESTNPQAALKSVDLMIKMLGFNAPIKNETKLSGTLNLKDLLNFED